MTDDLSRWELEHHAAPVTPLRVTECPQELIDIASAQPGHDVWAERLPGMTQLKYVARRRQGTDANPYLIVTTDLAELRDALRPDPPSQGRRPVTGQPVSHTQRPAVTRTQQWTTVLDALISNEPPGHAAR